MDPSTLLLVSVGVVLLYFHFILHTSQKKLKLEIESNYERLLQKAVEKEIKSLELIPKSDVGCSHTYVIEDKLQVENDGSHIGNIYVSRCTKCGHMYKESIYVNNP